MTIAVLDTPDHGLPAELLAEAADSFPSWHWPGWFTYTSFGKKTLDRREEIPVACWHVLGRLALCDVGRGLVPDLGLWGAGLHVMTAGSFLSSHTDAERHPLLGLQRRASAVLFLTRDWQPSWGGQLEFLAADGTVARSVTPAFGRLVVFPTADTLHAVAPLTCPAGVVRPTLALFWYGAPSPDAGTRTRAAFLADSTQERPAR